MAYQDRKNELRDKAISWQTSLADKVYSWREVLDAQRHFEVYGKRFGLLKEFRENGIL